MGTITDGVHEFEDLARAAAEAAPRTEAAEVAAAVEALGGGATGEQVAIVLEAAGSRWKRLADFMRPKDGNGVAGYAQLLIQIIRLVLG